MVKNIFIILTFFSIEVHSQTWNKLETEYNGFIQNSQNDLALNKAKEMYYWVKKNEADTSFNLPKSLSYIGSSFSNNDSASKYYELAILVFKKQKRFNNQFYVGTLNNLGTISEDLGDNFKAEKYYLQTELVYENTSNTNNQDYGIILKNLYLLFNKIGNYDKAELYLFKYLTFYKKVFKEENKEYASIIGEIGNFYLRIGNYKKAEQYLNQALSITKIFLGENHLDYAGILTSLGKMYSEMCDYKKAEEYLLKSLLIIKKLLPEEDIYYFVIFDELGNLYNEIDQNQKAEFYYLKSLNITTKSLGEDHIYNASTLHNIGNIYLYLFNYKKAEQYLNQALSITKKVLGENHSDYASILRSIGNMYNGMGEYKKAEEHLLKSLEITENTIGKDEIDYALCLNSIGIMYADYGNYKKAEPYLLKSSLNFKKVFGENHRNYYTSLLSIGNLYSKLGDYKKAEKCFLKSLDLQKKWFFEEKSEYAFTLESLGCLYFKMKDFKTAEEYLLLAYTINKRMINENFVWLTDKEKENYWNKSEIFFLRLSSFSAENNLKCSSINSLAFNSNLTSKALLLESSRDLNKEFANSNDPKYKLNFEQLKSDRIQYSKLISDGSDKYNLIKKLDSEVDSLEKLLLNNTSQYYDLRESIDINCKKIQSNLLKNEVAIEYVHYFDLTNFSFNYMALVLRPDNEYPQLIKLCSEEELKQYSPQTELNSLYDLIWKPLLPSLTNVNTIYYSPSGLLNNISFQALYKEESGQREYVMDKYSLHQLTSTRYLALDLKKKEHEQIEPSIALFGGINYNDYPNAKTDTTNHDQSTEAAYLYKNAIVLNRELDSTRTGASYLPGTKKEVEIIANVLNAKKWQVDVSEGKNATENKIKSYSGSNSKAILHIATHGFAFPEKEEKIKDLAFSMMSGNDKYKASDNPMIRSGLLFGGANMTWQGKGDSLLNTTNEDGVLTAYELSQLDLSNTKLAVLSACETGKGEIQGSEGTFGLKRALKLAGVDNMIVSLWKVPDDATMEMMTLFYTELANTKKPVSSFETAQKAMRLKYPNEPKKWAGFVFVR